MIVFLLLPMPLLYGLSIIVDKGLKQSAHVYYAEWNDLFRSRINADVVILGSSRAVNDISPAILDTVLRCHTYNLGMDGTHLSIQADRLRLYLQHNKAPKLLVHTVDLTSFAENNSMDNSLQFLPYLDDTAVLSITAKYRDHFSLADRYCPLFKYNNQMAIIEEGINSYRGKGVKAVKYKGYYPQDKVWDNSFDKYIQRVPNPVKIHVAGYSVDRLYSYLQLCREKKIKVVLVFPPVYYRFMDYCANKEYIFSIFRSCSDKYGVQFLDYSTDSLCLSKGNFYNSQHLNRKGAELFSQKLANDLAAMLTR